MPERDFPMINKETTAPPPPPEIVVRTMESDIKAIGGTPGMSAKAEEVSQMILNQRLSPAGRVPKPKINFAQAALVFSFVVLALAVLAGAVYVLYPLIAGYLPSKPAAAPTAQPIYLPPPPQSFSNQEFYHESYFRIDADYVTDFQMTETAAVSAEDLKTFKQRLLDALSNAPASARFYEFRVRRDNGQAVDILSFLSYIGADILDTGVLTSDFLPDFTAFAYKDAQGNIWPGYVLKLAAGKTSLLNGKEVAALEHSPQIGQLFLDPPGEQSAAGFTDETVESTPMRRIDFGGGKESFYYGWFNSRILILSTSKDGLILAMRHLVR